MKSFFRYLALAMLVVSCGGEIDPVDKPTPTPEATIESSGITVSTQEISYTDAPDKLTANFKEDGGELTFTLKTSDSWTAKAVNNRADSWATLSPASGSKGESTLKITVKDNDSYGERTADWEITCGSTKKAVRIVQKQNDAVIVTESKAEVPAEGGIVSIEVQHNVDVTVEIDDDAKEWIKRSGTKALSKDTYAFSISANEAQKQREGKIYVKSSLGDETFTVYQNGDVPALILGKKEYTVSGDGGQIEIEVTSNVNVSYEITEGKEWLNESSTKAMSTDKYVFIAAMNDTYESRDAEIVFRTEDGSLTEKVVVKQAAKDALIVAANEYTVPSEANTLSFVVSANVDFTFETDVDWIKRISTKGLTDTALNFSIEENTSEMERSGKIIINGNSLIQTILVKQKGANSNFAFIFNYEFSNTLPDKTKITECYFNVNSNVTTDNQLEIPADVNCAPVYWDLKGTVLNYYTSASVYRVGSAASLFQDWKSLEKVDLTNLDTKNCIDFGWMFSGCKSIKKIDLSPLNTENAMYMGGMFRECLSLEEVDLSAMNTTNCISIGQLFFACKSLKTIDLRSFDTSKCTHMADLFADCISLTSLDVSSFNTSKVTNMSKMFSNCRNLKSLDLRNFDTSNVTTMAGMFGAAPSMYAGEVEEGHIYDSDEDQKWMNELESRTFMNLENLNLSSFNTSKVEDMSSMFRQCIMLKTIDLSNFDTSNVRDMTMMFSTYTEGYGWEKLDVSNFNTEKVETMGSMFFGNLKLKELDLTSFRTNSLTDVGTMVNGCDNLEKLDISTMDFEKVSLDKFDCMLQTIGRNPNKCEIKVTDKVHRKLQRSNCNANDRDIIWNIPDLHISTDFSKDGTVKQLQKATKGKGINLVFMGDGYSDISIEKGYYEEDMRSGMEGFFFQHPYKSYREYFNVYMIYVVSKTDIQSKDETLKVDYSAKNAGGDVVIDGDHDKAEEYARKAIADFNWNEVAVGVISNTSQGGGTCYQYEPDINGKGDYGQGFSVAYVPRGFGDVHIQYVTAHEMAGHGFAKLADEYAHDIPGYSISNTDKEDFRYKESLGWFKNVTLKGDPIKWQKYMDDSRYSAQDLDKYPGGYTYPDDFYSPSFSGIMKTTNGYFNAPSREAIYYRINKLINGPDWKYDHEKFVQFDLDNFFVPVL
ncbi:MAG: BspA family leucine-rich repeat surface protein [Bacteroidales bacterium]|nr:BspA family leucine-rich repeat surface protein [Bacteroidales bacterium]